jgi:hypothetical protein
MADKTVEFVTQAQEATRSIYESMQGMGEMQLDIWQRLGAVQQGALSQTFEAATDQLELIGKVKDPHEYASAEAELMKSYGQRYADSLKQVVDIMVDVWEQYGDRWEKATNTVTGKVKQPTKKVKEPIKEVA